MGLIILTPLLLLSISNAEVRETRTDVLAKTTQGDYLGFRVDMGSNKSALYYGSGDVFLGIPFVEPITAETKFKYPKPLCGGGVPGTSPYNATFYRHACPQTDECQDVERSVDCLYLNIFTPNVSSTSKFPVMFYIHGGGLQTGCAHMYQYMGIISNLVSRGVVVVTIQYRVGLLGFFTTFTDEFPPNRGMLDQVEALRWVNKNIEHFGGDSKKITIFGESAGAASVGAHTYSPLSRGLFQQAVLQSGVLQTCFQGTYGFRNVSFDRANKLCGITETQWKSKDFSKLKPCLDALGEKELARMDSNNTLGWAVDQDDYFMPDIPKNLTKNRPNLPTMIGTMKDEWDLFWEFFLNSGQMHLKEFSRKIVEDFMHMAFPDFMSPNSTGLLFDIMEKAYLPKKSTNPEYIDWFIASTDFFTAMVFTGLATQEVNLQLENNNDNVYLFEQTYSSKIGRYPEVPELTELNFVPHVNELRLLFKMDTEWKAALGRNEVSTHDYEMADWYGEVWTNFAKFGKPFQNNSWTPVKDFKNKNYFQIDLPANEGMRMRDNYRYTDDVLWNSVLPSLFGDRPQRSENYNLTDDQLIRIREERTVTCEVQSTNKNEPLIAPAPKVTLKDFLASNTDATTVDEASSLIADSPEALSGFDNNSTSLSKAISVIMAFVLPALLNN